MNFSWRLIRHSWGHIKKPWSQIFRGVINPVHNIPIFFPTSINFFYWSVISSTLTKVYTRNYSSHTFFWRFCFGFWMPWGTSKSALYYSTFSLTPRVFFTGLARILRLITRFRHLQQKSKPPFKGSKQFSNVFRYLTKVF